MKLKALLLILAAACANAQTTGAPWIDTTSTIGASNLFNPLNAKLNFQIVAGAPSALACTAGKDLAYNSVAQTWHGCIVTGTPGTWAQIDAAMTFGTGLTRSVNAVTCLTGSGSQLGCISAADWTTFNSKVTNPLTTAGDIFVGGSSGTPSRLAAGALDTVLQGGGAATAPSFVSLVNCGDSSHAMAYSTSTHLWSCQAITGSGGGVADPGGNGMMSRTALNTTVARTITGTANLLTVTNGDGVAGNPTLTVGSNVARLDQGNTFATGVQDLSAATNLRIPNVSGYTPTLNGHFGFDTSTSTYKGYVGATVKTFAFLDSNITGNAATATALAATPSKCSAGNYPLGVDAGGNAQNCTSAGISANQTCTFISSASSCSITYTTALSDAAIASDPFCVYTDVTPNVGFLAGSWTKSTTVLAINFSPAPTRPGKCSVNTSGGSGGGGGGGTPGGVNGQLQINSSGAFGGRTIGPGLTDDGTAVKLDTLAVRTFLSGSASLTHGVITAGNCASQDITVTGASLGDRLIVGAPAELLSFTLFPQYAVISANTVRIRLCNPTGSSITPTASITWNVDVVKAF